MPDTLIASKLQTQAGGHDRPLRVVMADDDRNDHLLVLMAAEEAHLEADFTFFDSGVRLMLHLAGCRRLDELPDLILLDLHMPGLDGMRTLYELKTHPVLSQIPVVVFSGSTRTSDLAECLHAGAVWCETKPSDFSELVSFVASLPLLSRAEAYIDLTEDPAVDEASLSLLAADVVADIEDQVLVPAPSRDLAHRAG